MCPPTIMVVGGWEVRERQRGEPLEGCYVAMELVGWLACTGGLEMPGEGGPICAEAGTFQGFCLEGGPVHG